MPLDVTDTLGQILIAQFGSSIMFGITLLQTYLYFAKHASRDGWVIKALVIITGIFDTVHVIFSYHFAYYYLITAFGNISKLMKSAWSIQTVVLVGAPQLWLIQTFFAHRIYVLSEGKRIIPAFVVILTTLQLAFSIAWTARAVHLPLLSGLVRTSVNYSYILYALDISSNVVVTTVMIYYLRKRRSNFTNTQRLLNTLINFALKSCLLITTCTITSLLLTVFYPGTLYFLSSYEIMIRLYSNSLLSTLNNREELRARLNEPGNTVRLAGGADTNMDLLDISRVKRSHSTTSGDPTASCEA
jgi:hypothetical protein